MHIRLYRNVADITIVRVAEQHQRKGVATAMYKKLYEWADGEKIYVKHDGLTDEGALALEAMRKKGVVPRRRKLNPMAYVAVVEEGVRFETGVPVTFEYMRNLERAGYFGPRFQQDIEPAGRYLLFRDRAATRLPHWEFGRVSFNKPLVIAFNTGKSQVYDDNSWKAQLQRAYGTLGKDLSRKLLKEGYDGIVTVELGPNGRPVSTREIVDLTVVSRKR